MNKKWKKIMKFIWKQDEFSAILLYVKNFDFENSINYVKENFEIIKTINILSSNSAW